MKNNNYGINEKISKDIIIPTNVFRAINGLELSRTQKAKAIEFISLVMEYLMRKDRTLSSYIPFSSGLFIKIFNSKYRVFLNPLLESEIVQRTGKYNKETGEVFQYRINPDLMKNNLGVKKYRTTIKTDSKKDKFYNSFIEFYNQLEVPFDDLYGAVGKVKSRITLENFEINDSIHDGEYKIMLNNSIINGDKKTALRIAKEKGLDVIKDGRKLFVDYADNFIFQKRIHVEVAYIQAIRNLETKNIYVKRNKTNNRLEHNFANFPKPLFQLIIEKNGLVEIDAVNSQYGILANKMGSEIDPLFYEQATGGKLYESMQNTLQLTRDEVKEVMMQVVYSKPAYRSKNKTKVTTMYPNMMHYVNTYKQENYKALAIEMQKMEADIFIDGALRKLYEDGISAITKHDSIICFKKDVLHVRNTLLKILDDKDFKFTLK